MGLKIELKGTNKTSIEVLLMRRGPKFFSAPLKEANSDEQAVDSVTGLGLYRLIGTVHKGEGPKDQDGKAIDLAGQTAAIVVTEEDLETINAQGGSAFIWKAKADLSISNNVSENGELQSTTWVRNAVDPVLTDAPALVAQAAEAGLDAFLAATKAQNAQKRENARAAAREGAPARASVMDLLAQAKAKAEATA